MTNNRYITYKKEDEIWNVTINPENTENLNED